MVITKENLKNVKYVVTHNSTFHLDEVATVALIFWAHCRLNNLLYKDTNLLRDFVINRVLRVPRASEEEILSKLAVDKDVTLVVDVGLGRYDHHSDDPSKFRDPSDKYSKRAAFSLVSKELIPLFFDKIAANWFDINVALPIDRTDNYGQKKFQNSLAGMVASFNPSVKDGDEILAFCNAVEFVYSGLWQQLLWLDSPPVTKQRSSVINQDLSKGYVFNEEYVASTWYEGTGCKAVACYDKSKDQYQIVSIDSDKWNFNDVLDNMRFDKKLLSFIHPSGFMACAKDKGTIIELAEVAMDWWNEAAVGAGAFFATTGLTVELLATATL